MNIQHYEPLQKSFLTPLEALDRLKEPNFGVFEAIHCFERVELQC